MAQAMVGAPLKALPVAPWCPSGTCCVPEHRRGRSCTRGLPEPPVMARSGFGSRLVPFRERKPRHVLPGRPQGDGGGQGCATVARRDVVTHQTLP